MTDPKAKARARSSARWARANAIIPAIALDKEDAAEFARIIKLTGLSKSEAVRAAIRHFSANM